MFVYVSGVFLESFVAFRRVSKILAAYRFVRKLGEEEEGRVRARLDPEEEEKDS